MPTSSDNGSLLRLRLRLVHAAADLLMNRLRLPSSPVLARKIAKAILPFHHGRIVCPAILGYDVVMEENQSQFFYRYGWYERGTLDVVRRILRPGDVFVDAGASIGTISLYAAKLVGATGRVLSFEPLPFRFSCLAESVERNGFEQMTAFNFGLGVEEQATTIYADRLSPSMIEQEGSTDGQPSKVVPLRQVLASEGVDRVRMIKVDVEGYDLDVLKGCEDVLRGPEPPAICIEYGNYGMDAPLMAFLRSLPSYQIRRMAGTKDVVSDLVPFLDGDPMRAGDNVFCIPTGMTLAR